MTLILICLFSYIFIVYQLFLSKSQTPDYPTLRARLGTILSHSSDNGGSSHIYCYYPQSRAQINIRGEHLLTKVNHIQDCQNSWLGQAIFTEGSWVSEREKIWWYQGQKQLEEYQQAVKNGLYSES